MAHEVVDEGRDLLRELTRLALELREGFRKPVRDLDLPSAQLAHGFISWFPGTQSAVPASTISIAVLRTPGVSGPRSTRSPRKTTLRAYGCRGTPFASVAYPRRPSNATSSSRQPCTSPMMSKGPCSCLRCPTAAAARSRRLDLLRRLQHEHVAGSLPLQVRSDRCRRWGFAARRAGRSPAPAGRGCARGRALGQVQHDGHRQAVVLAGQRHHGLRVSGCTLVASMTVSLAAASRLRATKYRRSNASRVAAWLFSSSDTCPGRSPTTAPRWPGNASGRTWTCPTRRTDQRDKAKLGNGDLDRCAST